MNRCIHDNEVSLSAVVFFARSHSAIFHFACPADAKRQLPCIKSQETWLCFIFSIKAKNVYTSLVTQLEIVDDKIIFFFPAETFVSCFFRTLLLFNAILKIILFEMQDWEYSASISLPDAYQLHRLVRLSHRKMIPLHKMYTGDICRSL